MNEINFLIDILDDSKMSIMDKMTMVSNIKEILKSSRSNDEASEILTLSFESFLEKKLEEIKERVELKSEGNFSSKDGKSLFKRVT